MANKLNQEFDSIKYAEFCAGIGGFRIGIAMSRFPAKCVYANEIDEKCEDTYVANFNQRFDSKDIFDVKADELPQIDMLCSGFPCQPFSLAGKQNGFTDERGKIFLQLSKIISESKPSIVFLENVPNLSKHDKGQTFLRITNDLEKYGYSVYSDILDSANFGIPQSRPRLYVVAFLNTVYPNINFSFPPSTGKKITIRQVLEKQDYSIPISKKWGEYIDYYTQKIQPDDLSFTLPKTRVALERVSQNCDLDDCILQIRSSGIRAFSLDGQFPTFAVSHSGGGAMIPVLTKERRHISVQEIKRLMGFPDNYVFNISRTDSIKQLSNAVCPPVIQAIYEAIICATGVNLANAL